jgi:hypothetical protein
MMPSNSAFGIDLLDYGSKARRVAILGNVSFAMLALILVLTKKRVVITRIRLSGS